ncbi:MAG: hypothetical protein J7K39_00895 [Bacteroidales bacterium]|nr:hypothetical protein [Bacteroidales bacterium]RLD39143.1 MAG: hypothetical protein DRI74_01595 [Bacteroidota bacterium]
MQRGRLETYPTKILLAFTEAVGGNEDLFEWLLKNGYSELALLSKSLRGGEVSNQILIQKKFPQFAAFDAAIHGDVKAIIWLKKHNFIFLIRLADASRGTEIALNWFKKQDLKIFIMLAKKIKSFVDSQTYDVHKRHF